MARIEKTVFISYRRTDVYTALAVYENLKNQGYDVFFDYRSISSGDFEQIIISNIRARAHFLLILTPTALDRCDEPGDWLRREIEIAIDEKRNIVPLFFKSFRFGAPSVTEKLTGKLRNLSRYNGLNVHEDYFDEAMQRLGIQYLNIPLDTVLHPVSTEVQKVVKAEQVAADKALEQIEDAQELVKHDEKPVQLAEPDPMPDLKASLSVATSIEKQTEIPLAPVDELPIQHNEIQTKPDENLREKVADHKPVPEKAKFDRKAVQNLLKQKISIPNLNFRLVGGIAGGILALALIIWGGSSLSLGGGAIPEPTRTPQILFTKTLEPVTIGTAPATETSVPPTPTSGIVESMISEKDGMTLLYVPAGEFTMGSDEGSPDQQPAHVVYLDAFWIDETEVTWDMYYKNKLIARAGTPVYGVNWFDAEAYCQWAGRRLPSEAEWEKAARGENAFIYPWGNTPPNDGLLSRGINVREVGNFPNGASPYGALDMAGNISEWVADWYDSKYYAVSQNSNPQGPSSGVFRVIRGGSYKNADYAFQSSHRNATSPEQESPTIGFRCAMDASP